MSWREIVQIAEEMNGNWIKFRVTYDGIDKLARGEITELPGHVPAYAFVSKETLQGLLAGLELLLANGSFDLNPKSLLNNGLPHIKPLKVKDVLEAAVKSL